jgi:uncharacterized protein YbaR (Trm112 family)
MAIDELLLKILVCPETKQPVSLAEPALIENINRKIEAGTIKSKGGSPVASPIDAGLIRADGQVLYPIREDIPIMLIDEAIPL